MAEPKFKVGDRVRQSSKGRYHLNTTEPLIDQETVGVVTKVLERDGCSCFLYKVDWGNNALYPRCRQVYHSYECEIGHV